MAQKTKYKRSTVIVDDDVQRRMILSVSLLPVSGLMVAAVGVAIFTRNLSAEAAEVKGALPSLENMLVWLYGFVAVFGVLVVRQVTVLSHRVCGPNVRILEAMRRIRAGDIGFRVRLRKGDFNTEIAEATNCLLDWLNEHHPEGVKITDETVAAAKEEEPAAPPKEPAAPAS